MAAAISIALPFGLSSSPPALHNQDLMSVRVFSKRAFNVWLKQLFLLCSRVIFSHLSHTSRSSTSLMKQRRPQSREANAATTDFILTGRSGAIINWTTTGTVAAETKKDANRSETAIVRKTTTANFMS
jgi:hypothetical protein